MLTGRRRFSPGHGFVDLGNSRNLYGHRASTIRTHPSPVDVSDHALPRMPNIDGTLNDSADPRGGSPSVDVGPDDYMEALYELPS